MASNNFQKKTNAQLVATATQAHTTIAAAAASYGVSAPQLADLLASKNLLAATVQNVETTRAAYEAALQGRNEARTQTISALSSIGATIYNFPGVTPEMIAEAAYAVRDTTPTPAVPQMVTELTATPNANGTAVLKWKRNGNKPSVVFIVESKTEGGSWQPVVSTSRTRIVIPGVVPGVTRYFRVLSSRNDVYSPPSSSAIVYGPGSESSLKLAA